MNRRSLLTGLMNVSGLYGVGQMAFARTLSISAEGPVASTEYGKVRGIATGQVLSFRGISYGGPGDGANRFLPPTQPMPWMSVRDAVKAGPCSIQNPDPTIGDKNIFSSPLIGAYFSGGRSDAQDVTYETGSENCLVLNVLTPALHGHRPVMVYIHGGGFSQGTGALTLLSDRFVAEQEIVLVGVNHRLNVFGYSYLGEIDPEYADSGNVGQLDLIAALKWVKTNISNFGGDPSNVTIFGESGGGAKISTLLAMPTAKGLFRRAIIESGSLVSVRTKESAAADTRALLSALGLTSLPIQRLREIPADKLLAAYNKTLPAGSIGGPVIDGRSVPRQSWKPDAPPEAANIPLLLGSCKDESTLFSLNDQAVFSLDWETLRSREIKAGIREDKVDVLLARYRADYPKDSPSDLYFRIAGDRGLREKAQAQANAKFDQNAGDVFLYYFAWNTPIDGGRLRAFHTSELPLAMRLVLNPEAEELSKQIAGAWAAFARNGNPNHSGLPRWDKYFPERRPTMIFDAGKTALVENPGHDEMTMLKDYPTPLL
jgi:para-nitrobenzyl esterase